VPFYSFGCGIRRYKRLVTALEVTKYICSPSVVNGPMSAQQYNYISRRGLSKFSWVKTRTTQIHKFFQMGPHIKYFDQLAFRLNPNAKLVNISGLWSINSIKFFEHCHSKRHYANILGPISDIPYCTEPFSNHNLMCGYLKRIIPNTPTEDPVKINLIGDFVTKWLNENLTPLPNFQFNDKLVDEYMLKLKHFNHTQKQRLLNAYAELKTGFLSSKRGLRRFYKIWSFVKREFYEEPKHLRFINSRSNHFKIRIGPYIKLIEHQVYKLKYMVKGQIITELPKNIMRINKYPYFLETDYSSFEGSFSPTYTDNVECELWRYMLQNNPDTLNLLMGVYYTIDRYGVMRPRVEKCKNPKYRFDVVGTRMSGEMWTSLGNSFSNLMNMLFLCEINNINCDGFVEGDDGLFGMDKKILTKQSFADLGFNIKMKYVSELSNTSFCGNMFSTETLHSLVPLEQICRVFISCSSGYLDVGMRLQSMLLRSKAMSLYIQGKFTPIASVLAFNILRILGPGPIIIDPGESWWLWYIMDFSKNHNFDRIKIDFRDRLQYFKMTGISIQTQIFIENNFDNAKHIDDLRIPRDLMPRSYISGLH